MRSVGRGPLTVLVLGIVIAGGVGLQRLGPRAEPTAATDDAPSGAWVCPHGGRPGWTTRLFLADPGGRPATVRLTSIGASAPRSPVSLSMPAGSVSRVEVPSGERGSATLVEWFGGWVAAGWVARAGGGESGVAAEPCGPAGRSWFAPDGSTVRGEHTFVVVTNPSEADAVFSIALFTNDLPPIRQSRWTNVQLPGRRSTAFSVGKLAPNEAAVSAEVEVSSGRVAVSSLNVSDAGGVRSAMAAPALADRAILPVAAGAGQSEIVMAAPGASDVRFGATLLSDRQAQPAGGLGQVTQSARSAKSYPVITNGASAVEVEAHAPVAVALRSQGSLDTAATGGAVSPRSAWVVLPTVAGGTADPGVVLVNPGSEPAQVVVHLIGTPGDQLAADLTVVVPAHATTSVPADLLSPDPFAAAVVRSTGAPVVALGASTSLGRRGTDGYALALGVPIIGPP